MKKLCLSGAICLSLILAGCTSINQEHPADMTKLKKTTQTITEAKATPAKTIDPINVAFYTGGSKPHLPYHVVGETQVSKFNLAGNKRQEATIRSLMSQMAASLGGNAIVDIKHDDKTISGKVVTYKKIIV